MRSKFNCWLCSSLFIIIVVLLLTDVLSSQKPGGKVLALLQQQEQQQQPHEHEHEHSPQQQPQMNDLVSQETRCQPVEISFCNIPGYETLANFNNSIGHKTKEEAKGDLSKFGFLFGQFECREYIEPFLCSLYLPVCYTPPAESAPVPDILLPCRSECLLAKKSCEQLLINSAQSWPEMWDCDIFPNEHPCFIKHVNQSIDSLPQSHIVPAVVHEEDNPALGGGGSGGISTRQSICEEGFFDCQLRDPNDPGRKALCIEKGYICDGRTDCYWPGRQDEPGNGLDEMNCPMSSKQPTNSILCPEGQLNCNGEDYIDTATLIQCLLCVFVLPSLAIYLLVRFCRTCNEIEKPPPAYEPAPKLNDLEHTSETQEHIYQTHHTLSRPDLLGMFDDKPHFIPQLHQHNNNAPTIQPCAIYDTTDMNSVYERVNSGGYSGFSSVYDSYMHLPYSIEPKEDQHHQHHHHNKDDYLREPPAPPPPTPALPLTPAQQSIYLNTDCMPGMNHI